MALKALWTEFKTFAFKGNMIDLAVAVVIGAAFSGVINSLVQDVIMPGIIYITSTAAEAKNAVAKSVTGPVTPAPTTQASAEDQAKAAEMLATAGKNLADSTTPMVKAYNNVQDLEKMKAGMPADVQDQINKVSAELIAIQRATGTAAPAAPPAAPAPQAKAVDFNWKIGPINIGSFIGALINFLLIAAAVFITIVKLLGSVMKRMSPQEAPSDPVTKECPFCLSIIPIKARKCSHCTADQPATT